MQGLNTRLPGRVTACFLLAAAVCATFWPVVRNGFVGYDDPDYVTANPHVNTGLTRDNVAWAFTAAHANNWHPLTWISHQLDCTLFGLAPAGPHAVNLLFHVLNTMLLFWFLSGITGSIGRSAFVALIFGLHPLHVESVAWIAERKDVLSTFSGLLALVAYAAYSRKPGAGRYLAVAAPFAASLLAKPMLVTLPAVFLLLDWWPLKRGWRIGEKLPLFTLSALSAAATLWAQRRGGAIAAIGQLPLPLRLENAALSYLRYLGKTVWPIDLAVFYPFPAHGIPLWMAASSVAALAAISVLAWRLRAAHPWLAIGWCWYLLTLLPTIGIVQVGMQSMADRYMYVPMIGLLIAISWELARFRIVAPLAMAACAILTWRQIPVWNDGLTLFTHAVAVTRDNFVAHDNLGVELDRRGRSEEALAEYRETLRIQPGDRNGENNLAQASFEKGERLFNEGKTGDALASLEESLRYRPKNAMARAYAGVILLGRNEIQPAIGQLRMAVELDPTIVRAHVGLGVALANAGQDTEALHEFEEAVRHDPTSIEARFDLAMVLAGTGRGADALAQLDEILRRKPDYAPARQVRAALAARH
jgi:Flp pilus assembly protein TadD